MATKVLYQKPKSMIRPKIWNSAVEDAYRFQLAGYRDEKEYCSVSDDTEIERWAESGFIKKLQRKKDGYFYYFNKSRECADKDLFKIKIFEY
uniref:Meiosis expressed protein 1 n=1 Tax=Placozoa sp. H4 TaxID=1034858 RepID=F6K608_9METZ|nr:meiosis expressed protein 1 [Placozoa sp. H4]